MRGKIVNPWDCSIDQNCPHRLVHLSNLPPGCPVDDLKPFFSKYKIEYYHVFDNKALVQFVNPSDAEQFISENQNKLSIQKYPIKMSMSSLTHLIFTTGTKTAPSPVICIQVVNLRVYLGIQDIYDECSQFGRVMKIICFEKAAVNSVMQPIVPEQPVKYALVQMATVEQASLALANLSNAPRHLPCFQFRIQYSKNHDIVIKFNNSKSYDFTDPLAMAQFTQLREASAGERPFFVFEPSPEIDPVFDFWRPFIFDPSIVQALNVSGYNENTITFDKLRNLFCQYGPIQRIKFFHKNRKNALIIFKTSFYARLALAFMQNCPIEQNHNLIVECSFQHSNFLVREFNEHLYQDYKCGNEDLDLETYSNLSFPSQFVSFKYCKFDDFHFPQSAVLHKNLNIVQFQTVYDAVNFISQFNKMVINGRPIQLSFSKSPF